VSGGDPKGGLRHAPAETSPSTFGAGLTWKIEAGAATDVGPSPSQGRPIGAVELKIGAGADC